MEVLVPEELTLNELAKATGFNVTTNAHTHPTLFC